MRNPSHAPTFEQYSGRDKFVYRGITYECKEILGEGGTAVVYRFNSVSSTASLSAVAVKMEFAVECRGVDQFKEGVAFYWDAYWNKKIYGLGVLSGNPRDTTKRHYLLMPYFAGILAKDISLYSARELIEWFIMVASFIHEKMHLAHGVVHGDIKLDNVIFQSAKKKVFVIDFGLTEKVGNKAGQYQPPVVYDPKLGEVKLSPSEICPQTPPELFGQELVPAEPSQDAYALGQFLAALLRRTSNVSSEEEAKIRLVISSLRAILPKERCPIPAAISKLHVNFVATVPRLLVDKSVLFQKHRIDVVQAGEQVVAPESISVPLLTKAMADQALKSAAPCF